ncbi:MAG: ABC transporter permease [Bacteroidota bacterium]
MIRSIGSYVLFLGHTMSGIQKGRFLYESFKLECVKVGTDSVYVVSVVAILTGGVSLVQTTFALSAPYIEDYIIGMVVRDTTFALIPTLIALVFSGKVGSGMSGELGSMRISEQIDALEVMGINAASFLVLPKLLASIIMLPILICISAFLSLASGYLLAYLGGFISGDSYVYGIRYDFKEINLVIIFTKAFLHGFIVSSISSYQGFHTRGGALDVGKSNTRSIVLCSVMILVTDFLVTRIFGSF